MTYSYYFSVPRIVYASQYFRLKTRWLRQRKNEKENQQKKEQKRKAHYMSLHQKVKTADSDRKNF